MNHGPAIVRVCIALATLLTPAGADSPAPSGPQELWAGYDPRAEPLEMRTISQWSEHGAHYRELEFTAMRHGGAPVRVYAIYAAPEGEGKFPGVLHIHGGGQTAAPQWLQFWTSRGYAALTFDFTGRWGERQKYTDWGNLKHGNMGEAGPMLLATEPSVRASSWYLWMCVARRALTALESQSEVDPQRLGIFGISVGGTLTWPTAAMDKRVKAACAIYGVGWNNYPVDVAEPDTGAADPAVQVWRRTMASEAYAPLVTCPILFLNSTNDQHGNMDRTDATLRLVTSPVRAAYTPRYRHHIGAREGRNLSLWMDTWLKGKPVDWPRSPRMSVELDEHGVPRLVASVDDVGQVESVEIIYAVENRYPLSRFWRSTRADRRGSIWLASAPVMNVADPLYALATVRYRSGVCLSSNLASIIPAQLGRAVATDAWSPILSDFRTGFDGWVTSSPGTDPIEPVRSLIRLAEGPEGIHGITVTAPIPLSTHKIGDPRWRGREGDRLQFKIYAAARRSVRIVVHEKEFAPGWTQYAHSLELEPGEQWQCFRLSATHFATEGGAPLSSWSAVQMLEIVTTGGEGPEPVYAGLEWVTLDE
jgi:dienelactone hydrolase